MKLEHACFYLLKQNKQNKVLFALSDGINPEPRLIESWCAGPEESLALTNLTELERLGNSNEIWSEPFSREFLHVLVENQINLDTLDSLQLLANIRATATPLSDIAKIKNLLQQLQAERSKIKTSRQRLWHNFSHKAAI